MPLQHKLGRQPRAFSPRVMHLSSLLGAVDLPPPPPSVDWTKGVDKWGMMLNDRLGDCTCAAAYHARQVWTNNIGVEFTDPDAEVLALYEKACGYDPNNSATDRGGVEQSVLGYLMVQGYPVAVGEPDKLLAFFEVDPRNKDDIKTAISECGVCYIGFEVPDSIDEAPGSTWDVEDGASIEGGHAVILVGYDEDTVTLISWGSLYKMTWDFFQKYTDEAYALVSNLWVRDGQTLLGLTPEQLEAMMSAIKS